MSKNIIRDGYTRGATIKPKPGLYEGLSIKFRPMLPEQVDAVTGRVADKRTAGHFAEATVTIAAALAKQITEWDEVGPDGKPVPIKAEHFRNLPSPLLRRLYDVVSGYDPGDLPEQSSEPEHDEYLSDLTEAIATASPPPSALEKDEKNLPKG